MTFAPGRRQFLRFLAGSPLLAPAWSQAPALKLDTAANALSVMDFEEVARKQLPPAHWGYMASGVDDDLTLKTNREGMQRFQLRPRRLAGVSAVDLKTELFGQTFDMPLFLCPLSAQRMYHQDGEVAAARAAKEKKVLQMLSSGTSFPVEEVNPAFGGKLWYQLYMPARWEGTVKLVHRVEEAGCPVLVWTIDLVTGRNLETGERFRRADTRTCTTCHTSARGGRTIDTWPMYKG